MHGKVITCAVGKRGNAIIEQMRGLWSMLIVANSLKLFKFCGFFVARCFYSQKSNCSVKLNDTIISHCKLSLCKTIV